MQFIKRDEKANEGINLSAWLPGTPPRADTEKRFLLMILLRIYPTSLQ